MIARLREVLRYQNRFVRVFDDEVRFPDGRAGTYLRITPPADTGDGVVIVPRTTRPEPRYGLVRTYRYPIEATQWGFPRGFSDAIDADPLASAARELAEETGASVEPADLTLLGRVTPDSGLLSSRVHAILATLPDEPRSPQDPEVDAVRWVTGGQLLTEVRTGEIEDGFTLAAIALLVAREGGL